MSFPDIEIYVKNLSVNEISIWSGKLFGESPTSRLGSTTLVQRATVRAKWSRILENVLTEPEFTSIYFSPNKTKWQTDLECARDAFSHFQLEVRCSASGWSENSQEGGRLDSKLIVREHTELNGSENRYINFYWHHNFCVSIISNTPASLFSRQINNATQSLSVFRPGKFQGQYGMEA